MTKSVVSQKEMSDQVVKTQSLQFEFADHLPDVPVQPETLLLIDLEMQESSVDLRVLSQLVLNDLGATLQVLRLAAHEYRNAEICPTRIEDYISDLGLDACMEAVSARTVARDFRHRAIVETWAHSREIAHCSMLIAGETQEVNPDEAYLVGLFHAIGLLPSVLGWDGCGASTTDYSQRGFKLARKWSLPRFVVEYFRETQMAGSRTLWPAIVEKAHWRAGGPSIPCTYRNDLHLQLLRVV
jgi:HD-like signal output (HDOD) protein